MPAIAALLQLEEESGVFFLFRVARCICLQDVRATMALLAAMPTVNLQLWSQLSQAAGCHDCWLLARECASAALGALPADRRDLSAVAAASEVPELGAQGWYHLSVAEMQQGQVRLPTAQPHIIIVEIDSSDACQT